MWGQGHDLCPLRCGPLQAHILSKTAKLTHFARAAGAALGTRSRWPSSKTFSGLDQSDKMYRDTVRMGNCLVWVRTR